jgi:thioredoxin reductase
MEHSDVIIIGAGPAGLFAGFYVGLRGLSFRFVDPLPEPGGRLAAYYPEKYVYDVPGFPKVIAKDLVKKLLEQLKPFHPKFHLGEQAETLKRDGELFEIGTSRGNGFTGKAVIIASGMGAFEPRRLGVAGEKEFEHKGVYFAVTSKTELREKRVLIVGGGDSAVDWALNLLDTARDITLIHRRSEFRAHELSVQKLMNARDEGRVKILTPYELRAIRGDGWVREAIIFHNQSQEEHQLEVDAVLIFAGYLSKLGPLANWGLELEQNKIKVDSTMATNIPGVYACGDVVTYPGKLPMIVVSFGEAAIAANHAVAYANPSLKVDPGYSSVKGLGKVAA